MIEPMEIHRLNEMKHYDKALFERLYRETEALRRTLTYQINPRILGVSSDIIKSYFDDKFIHAYEKYYEKYPEGSADNLKGYLINALQIFKYRILRKGYQESIYHNQVDMEVCKKLINIIPDSEEVDDKSLFLEVALGFMKKNLSENAYLVFELELNPPHYISNKLKNPNLKIPAKLIAEYLNLGLTNNAINYVNDLRKEIAYTISEAREYFDNNSLEYNFNN